MITLPSSVRIYLAAGAVDLRKSIDGLSAIVSERNHDLYSGHLYVFTSRRGDRIKILTWSTGGFVLYYKRLDAGTFRIPEPMIEGDTARLIDERAFDDLIDGLELAPVRRRAVH